MLPTTPPSMGPPLVARSLPLDALRGLAIILMVFSSRIPYGVLPDWMYHAQVPPPAHVFVPTIPGITWVDLVFPFFLFSMGAAIPLALQAKLARGDSWFSLSTWIFKRGALLLFFAIYVKHIQPQVMATAPGSFEWLLALAGFLLLFPMLSALPANWSKPLRLMVRLCGWAAAIALLLVFRAKDGSGFSVARSDIIILVLANVAITGSFIWLATRERLDWRIGMLAFLLALRLTQSLPGWGQWTWNLSPWPWIGTVYFQQYLFIIIPGTIAGDLLLKYGQTPRAESAIPRSYWLIAVTGVLMSALILVGMKARLVEVTTVAAIALSGLGLWQIRTASDDTAKLLRALFGWGVFWLLLGLAFEPFEGGIKKDKANLSYYFVTSGLAFLLLTSLIVAIDLAKWRRTFSLLIATGQNPLVAYAGVQSLIPPLLGISGVGTVVAQYTAAPWLGVLRGAVYTWLTCAAAAMATKRGWFLKT
jgi:predicted acyltransferase